MTACKYCGGMWSYDHRCEAVKALAEKDTLIANLRKDHELGKEEIANIYLAKLTAAREEIERLKRMNASLEEDAYTIVSERLKAELAETRDVLRATEATLED